MNNIPKDGAPDAVRARLAQRANTQPSLAQAKMRAIRTTGRPGQRNGRTPHSKNFYASGPGDFLKPGDFETL